MSPFVPIKLYPVNIQTRASEYGELVREQVWKKQHFCIVVMKSGVLNKFEKGKKIVRECKQRFTISLSTKKSIQSVCRNTDIVIFCPNQPSLFMLSPGSLAAAYDFALECLL